MAKQVAVFGAGGYLGSTAFGFLQRASSLYGTGLGGVSSPRCICATGIGSQSLNRVLSKNFVLGYAGEDMVRLTNMQSVESIANRLSGYHAVLVGTAYQLEVRPVTGNTYEQSPNDKTVEFYLDEIKSGRFDVTDMETHMTLFKNTLEGCKQAGIQHIVVVETPQTPDPKPFAKELDEAGVPFTYIHARCDELVSVQDWVHYKGVQSNLDIQSFTFSSGYASETGYKAGDWMDALADTRFGGEGTSIPREDIAALAVQSLQSLDWSTSRCLEVSSVGPLKEAVTVAGKRPDREWCANSNVLAEKLAPVK